MDELTKLRLRGVKLLAIFGWACTGALLLLGLLFNLHNPLLAVLVSASLNIIPTVAARSNRYDMPVLSMFGVAASIQPALLVYLLNGHPWQMEGHMYFFVGLAALTLLCDWRPIAVAVGVIAVHHLLLSYIAPEWVFIGSGNLPRVMVHAVAVTMVLGLLGPVMIHMGKLFVQQSEARTASERAADSAHAALKAAKAAEEAADAERQKRLQAERSANADARRSELLELAGAFESSVAKVVQSVSASAEQLERAARNMHRFANDAGQQSASAARDAESASRNAVEVSERVTELARSIATIAANAEQQAQLGQSARSSSLTGESVIQTLANRTTDIESFVSLIDSVAGRTNLLALNATIEAARAGDAGRGFSVVASEVKALATKTKDATSEINDLVSAIGSGAGEAQQVIGEIAAAMSQLADAAAVMRREIGDQHGVASLIENTAAESAAGADMIAQRIDEVARSAGEAVQLSTEVQDSASSLSGIAQELQSATSEFLSKLRVA